MAPKGRLPILFTPPSSARLLIEDIQSAVERSFGVSRADLTCRRRTQDLTVPRQIAMYLARRLTTRSFPEIGRMFGNRDHASILNAVRKVEHLCLRDAALAQRIETIAAELTH